MMDLQTRKLNAIGFLIGLQDEKTLDKIETAILESKNQQGLDKDLKPIGRDELINRARQSNQDYLNGKFKTQEQLEIESENC